MKRDGSGMEQKKYILLEGETFYALFGEKKPEGPVVDLDAAQQDHENPEISSTGAEEHREDSGQFCKDLPGTDERSRRKCCRSWDGDSGSF